MTMTTQREDSDLGRWTLVRWRPPALEGLIESIWFFEGVVQHRERHFPTGLLDLIVQLGSRSETFRIVEGDPAGSCPSSSVGGLLVGPLVIEAPGCACRVLGVRLTPTGAYALLGVPLHELTGTTVDLYDIVGREAEELAERCDEAASDKARVRIVGDWIVERLARARPSDPCIAGAALTIERCGGRIPIGTLPERLGLSKTRLRSGFQEQVGVTPKRFARIIRFRGVAAALRSGPARLSRLALDHGYYDQAHMNAEFRELAGLAPGEFLAAVRYPDATSLAE